MVNLEEIVEPLRTDTEDSSSHNEENTTQRNRRKRKGSKKRQSSGSQASSRPPTPGDDPSISPPVLPLTSDLQPNDPEEHNTGQQADLPKQDALPTQEDHRDRFYNDYRKVAEEYDKEFLKKYGDDLDTTMIFAGLFSAVTSAFIIEVNSELKPDPGDETTALLRLLIYKIDNTTFGSNVPTLPQWTGPPRAIVHVQVLLFTSLAVSLLSAFLAMLGKQWLNCYDSTEMRGSAIERGRNRQLKLDGIVAWCFHNVMEGLLSMLQAALLLLGCALSRYFWEASITVASAVLCATLFSVVLYFSIVIAGTAFESCPYKTPLARTLRRIHHQLLPTLRSAPSAISTFVSSLLSHSSQYSVCYWGFRNWWQMIRQPWYSVHNITATLWAPFLLISLTWDALLLGRATLQLLLAFGGMVYHWLVIISPQPHHPDQQKIVPDLQTIVPDLHSISWVLRTSLDKSVHLSALKPLASMLELSHFHPDIVVDCFNVFVSCISINDGKVVIMQGLEPLAKISTSCFLGTLHNLTVVDPTSSILADLHQRYDTLFPPEVDFTGLPLHSTMTMIHTLTNRFGNPRYTWWDNRRPPGLKHISFSRRMAEPAQISYQRTQRRKVPRWILRSALHLLSLGSLCPAPVVVDCLKIVAIDLGCDFSDTAGLDDSAQAKRISGFIIQRLKTASEANDANLIHSKHKALNVFFLHAIVLGLQGNQDMADAFLDAIPSPALEKWHRISQYLAPLVDKRTPPSMNRIVTTHSTAVPWKNVSNGSEAVGRWATAVLEVSYTEEIGKYVAGALLQIASTDSLRPYIPVDVWAYLKRKPSLPPGGSWGHRSATEVPGVVPYIQGLGDLDILKSYFLVVWSEWYYFDPLVLREMEVSIKEDFCGIGMRCHREELIGRLNHILAELDQGLDHLKVHQPYTSIYRIKHIKADHRRLKQVLLEIDEEATNNSACAPLKFIPFR